MKTVFHINSNLKIKVGYSPVELVSDNYVTAYT